MADHGSQDRVFRALDEFVVEVPSWAFANTGTRFGKFAQPAAATTIEEKFRDAAEVNRLTGVTPTLALHVLWDLPNGEADLELIRQLAKETGVRPGSMNPNLFQDQQYKFGSICNPDAAVRRHATEHLLQSVALARELGCAEVSLWVSDGSNYPGTQSMRRRIGWLREALQAAHAELAPGQTLLVEYKPFEPAFYHTDLADWGMALEMARAAGPQAKVLVDTGHHYQSTNIEQIVAWLLELEALGGFHLNDRKYADDDLTLGSIDPYQVFRIFHELQYQRYLHPDASLPAFMVDQSHNLKGKIEATVQTVATAQELWARAALVDHAALVKLQDSCDIVGAEEVFRDAFWTDVRPMVQAWRSCRHLPPNPLEALHEGGYVQRVARERAASNRNSVSSYA